MAFSEHEQREEFERWREYGERRGWISSPKKRRSDESIRDEILHILRKSGDVDASDIEVTVKDGHVVLKGYIDNKYEHRLAELLVEQIWEVLDVTNELKFKQFGFQYKQDKRKTS